ncbi:MAG: helix-turn-helix transcriptional regulator [Clostridia bacterium]|nr:helix-turn-helix transcriptional regulator [Clostridia bacterium]
MDYQPHALSVHDWLLLTDIYTAFTAERADDFVFDGEMHDFWELVYVTSGSIWAAEEQRIVHLKENMFILHKPQAFHRLWCDGDGATIKIISFAAFGTATKMLEQRGGVLPWHLHEPLCTTIDHAASLIDGDAARAGRVIAGLQYVLTELAHITEQPLTDHSRLDFELLMQTIHRCYRENPTLKELAARCNMSESKMKSVFRSVYDMGIMKYVTKLRIRDAAQMLTHGDSIENICDTLHYSDRNYFSYAFKREVGLSPQEYRRKYRKT